jgi:integrase
MSKATKGTVVVENFKERLRLRWRNAGNRFCLSLGVSDTKENRKLAETRARQIELDIISGNFDTTLAKYKPEQVKVQSAATAWEIGLPITVHDLWERFTAYKAKKLDPRTLEKYYPVGKLLKEYFGDRNVNYIKLEAFEQFTTWLLQRNSEQTVKDRLVLLSACWQWAKQPRQNFVEIDPWKAILEEFKVAPKQPAKPFTKQEVQLILETFRSHSQYKHYADYVEFLLLTGVRTAEAIGLCWKHISDDFSTIWIGESLSRGVRKSTKTNKSRTIPLNNKLKALLKARKPDDCKPDDLVFPSPDGLAIDDHNFRNRAWIKMLEKAGIEYRKPYNTRHTFISHCLESGMNPVLVAQITGHDVQTLYQNYAGVVVSRPTLPELF